MLKAMLLIRNAIVNVKAMLLIRNDIVNVKAMLLMLQCYYQSKGNAFVTAMLLCQLSSLCAG